jgi:hypothetical protein
MDNDNDPYIIAFNKIVTCLPIHSYIINTATSIITYYCGQNNTLVLSLDTINK